MAIRDWSKTAASNDSSPVPTDEQFPEGMAPSAVNDRVRAHMAAHKTQWTQAEWFDHGDTVTRKDSNKLNISGTHTVTYAVGRRLRAVDGSGDYHYATITEGSISSGDTIITASLDTGSFSGTITGVELAILDPSSTALPWNVNFGSAGEMLLPYQPAFLAYNSADDADVTGDGTEVTVEFDTEVFDRGGDYDNSTDTFTAPVTGLYSFGGSVFIQGVGSGHRLVLELITSNRDYRLWEVDADAIDIGGGGTDITLNWSVPLADMSASDTAFVRLTVSSGSKTIDIQGEAGASTFFAGHLVA